ncbi:g5907 [Coccomyxa elongata]
MTFLFSPPTIQHFFLEPDDLIAFGPAIQPFTQRVFGLPPERFLPKHSAMLATLRGLLAPSGLDRRLQDVAAAMQLHLHARWADGEVSLMEVVQDMVFEPTVATLFGARFCGRHKLTALRDAFFKFESGFELAASPLPHLLQRSFCAARSHLLSAFRVSVVERDFEGELIGDLIKQSAIEPDLAPNVMLAVLWAALSNSIPAAFWSTAFLLLPQHRSHLALILKSLPSAPPPDAPPSQASEHLASLVQVALDRRGPLAAAVAEAVRLRSPGVDLRAAAADARLPLCDGRLLAVKKGQLLAVSPHESHLDERLFGPRAHEFDPGRPGLAAVVGVAGVGGIAGFAFGGGRYRCPGRFFAEAQIVLAVALLLSRYDVRLVSKDLRTTGPLAAGSSGPGTKEVALSGDARGGPSAKIGTGHHRSSCESSNQGSPGDPNGLLPQPELRRQVGIRWPKEECIVSVRRIS